MSKLFIFGFLGILQTGFLPGIIILYAITRRAGLKLNLLEKFCFSFGLSLLANYIAVFVLTGLTGVSIQTWLYPVLILETLVLGTLIRSKDFRKWFSENNRNSLQNFLLWLSLCLLVYFFKKPFDAIFSWDGVLSWHRWALAWFEGHAPKQSWSYPQLGPTNWAIIQTLTEQPDVVIFTRFLTNLFSVFCMLSFAAFLFVNPVAIFSAGVLGFLFFNTYFAQYAFHDGMVDFCLIYFSSLTTLSLLQFSRTGLKTWFYLFSIFASAAAATKQSGIAFYGLHAAILIISLFFNEKVNQFFKTKISKIEKKDALRTGLPIILTGIWYLKKAYDFRMGLDQSEMQWIASGVVTSRSDRFVVGMHSVFFGNIIRTLTSTVLIVGILNFLTRKEYPLLNRALIALTLLAALIFWGLFLSYPSDLRNLGIVVPFLILVSAYGWAPFIQKINFPRIQISTKQKLIFSVIALCSIVTVMLTTTALPPFAQQKLDQYGVLIVCFSVAFLCLWISIRFTLITSLTLALSTTFTINEQSALNAHQEKWNELGQTNLNRELRTLLKTKGIHGKILTDYAFLAVLPELRNHSIGYAAYIQKDWIKSQLEKDPNIRYLLIPESGRIYTNIQNYYIDPDTKNWIADLIQRKKIRQVFKATDSLPQWNFEKDTYILYEFNGPDLGAAASQLRHPYKNHIFQSCLSLIANS